MEIKDEIAKRLFAVIQFYNENETAIKRMNNATGRNILNCVQAVKNSFKPLGYNYKDGKPKEIITTNLKAMPIKEEQKVEKEKTEQEEPTGILLTVGGTDNEDIKVEEEAPEAPEAPKPKKKNNGNN